MPSLEMRSADAGNVGATTDTNAINTTLPDPASVSNNVTLTLYRGAKSTTPASRDELTWEVFCDEVEALCNAPGTATDKRDLLAFGPYRLREGTTRAAANVEAMSAVCMLDVDACTDVDALEARIRTLGVAAIVHTTPSDDPTANVRKLRVFVRLDSEHDPADAGAVRAGVAALLGVEQDPQTLNADRIGFCGPLAGKPPRMVERYDGRPLALAEIPRVDVARAPATSSTTPAATTAATLPVDDHVAALVAPVYAQGGRHELVRALGGWLADRGVDDARIAGIVSQLPSDRKSKRVEEALKAAQQARDCNLFGPAETPHPPAEGALRRRLGHPVLAALEALVPAAAGSVVRRVTDGEQGWLDFGTEPPTRTFLVPELELGVGRAYGFLGESNAGKTLVLMQLEVDLALGRPVFGRFAGPGHPVPVLRMAWEASHRPEEDYPRLMHAAGAGPEIKRFLKAYDPRQDGRFLSDNPAANREWLLRLTAPFAGGIVVVDSFVAACSGLDENSAEIATPLYDIEGVSRENGVSFIVAAHFGKSDHTRARGHSAIEGALGATVRIEAGPSSNMRSVHPGKRYRYGAEPFGLRVDDTNLDGSAFVLTPELRRTGQASWGVRVTAIDAEPAASNGRGANFASANAAKQADYAANVRSAGEAIMKCFPKVGWPKQKELVGLGGGKRNPSVEALKRLTMAGLLEYCAQGYAKTQAGQDASPARIAEALGAVAGFQR